MPLLCCISYLAVRVVSMEFSEGTDVDVEEDFVEIRDIELPDDDPLQCGSEFCVICNELATEQQPSIFVGTEVGLRAGIYIGQNFAVYRPLMCPFHKCDLRNEETWHKQKKSQNI